MDTPHPRGVNAIAFEAIHGNVSVMTEFGIIAHNAPSGMKVFEIPRDRCVVLDKDSVLTSKLESIRESILNGTFDRANQPTVTLQFAHSRTHNQSPGPRVDCHCTTKKCTSCKCAKAKTGCTSSCKCNGNCENPNN